MIDYLALIKDTKAYQAVLNDKKLGRLSHAYLILSQDKLLLKNYLKEFAKLFVCSFDQPCSTCRACVLTDKESYQDVLFYPKNADKGIQTEDINDLIEQSYIRPIENDKKVFILCDGHNMNASAQNKLLKTLEEPPKNVHILIGATSEYSLLSTVLSRVKKLEIPFFTSEKIFNALKDECLDHDKLNSAIMASDNTVGNALALYSDQNLYLATSLVKDMLVNMKTSSDVLSYSLKISAMPTDTAYFLSVLELYLRDLMVALNNSKALVRDQKIIQLKDNITNLTLGAVLHALGSVNEANKRLKYNANPVMLIEWLLFQILEGKYKWQKL